MQGSKPGFTINHIQFFTKELLDRLNHFLNDQDTFTYYDYGTFWYKCTKCVLTLINKFVFLPERTALELYIQRQFCGLEKNVIKLIGSYMEPLNDLIEILCSPSFPYFQGDLNSLNVQSFRLQIQNDKFTIWLYRKCIIRLIKSLIGTYHISINELETVLNQFQLSSLLNPEN
jgi:hypothetical protein